MRISDWSSDVCSSDLNGVDLRQTLAEVKHLEDLMEANPLAALNAILLRSGPRKADGQPVSLFEMAAHIVQMGQDGYHKAVTAMPQRQQQTSPEVEQLRAEMAQLKAEQTDRKSTRLNSS